MSPSPMGARLDFTIQGGLQHLFLLRGQIGGFIFPIKCHQPNLLFGFKIIIDHSQAAPSAFAPALVSPTNFAEPARPRHHVTCARICCQLALKFPLTLIIKVLVEVPGESRRFNKFHWLQYAPMGDK